MDDSRIPHSRAIIETMKPAVPLYRCTVAPLYRCTGKTVNP